WLRTAAAAGRGLPTAARRAARAAHPHAPTRTHKPAARLCRLRDMPVAPHNRVHSPLPVPPMAYASLATGVLLAAGYGSRFDPDGLHNKRLARLPDGMPVAHESAHRLLRVVPHVIAVVRPGSDPLARVLNDAGCDVVFSTDAQRGMGASLAAAVAASDDAESWIVALADMPRIAVETLEALARVLDGGASIV